VTGTVTKEYSRLIMERLGQAFSIEGTEGSKKILKKIYEQIGDTDVLSVKVEVE
jgi:hypothetical protein